MHIFSCSFVSLITTKTQLCFDWFWCKETTIFPHTECTPWWGEGKKHMLQNIQQAHFLFYPKKKQKKKQPLTTKKIEPFGTLHEKKQCTPGASCYFNLLFKLSLCTENIHQLFFQGLFFTCPWVSVLSPGGCLTAELCSLLVFSQHWKCFCKWGWFRSLQQRQSFLL